MLNYIVLLPFKYFGKPSPKIATFLRKQYINVAYKPHNWLAKHFKNCKEKININKTFQQISIQRYMKFEVFLIINLFNSCSNIYNFWKKY